MYMVTRELHFSYGHRLLNYHGKCMHPHGHNAKVEIDIVADGLDPRGMVMDFGDVKAAIQGWIDKELDHQMILRRDDPLLPALQAMGEPCYVLDDNPTAERLARLVYDFARSQGFPVREVRFWETIHCWATYRGESAS